MPEAGQIVGGKYRLERLVGSGGFASVWAASNVMLDRIVALKILSESYARMPGFLPRFLREAKLASKKIHKNIVAVEDIDQTSDGMVYLVMELLEGHTLSEEIKGGKSLDIDWALTIIIATLEGLAAAHKLNIIHRDIKPANIFISNEDRPGPRVRILDLGLAKDLVHDEELTSTDQMVGTPSYLAPEMFMGPQVLNWAPTADVFACGMLLFRMLAGGLPFDRSVANLTPVEQFLSRANFYRNIKKMPGPARYKKSIPDAIDKVVQKSISIEQAERYADAEEMLRALRQAAEKTVFSKTTPHTIPMDSDDETLSDGNEKTEEHDLEGQTRHELDLYEQRNTSETGEFAENVEYEGDKFGKTKIEPNPFALMDQIAQDSDDDEFDESAVTKVHELKDRPNSPTPKPRRDSPSESFRPQFGEDNRATPDPLPVPTTTPTAIPVRDSVPSPSGSHPLVQDPRSSSGANPIPDTLSSSGTHSVPDPRSSSGAHSLDLYASSPSQPVLQDPRSSSGSVPVSGSGSNSSPDMFSSSPSHPAPVRATQPGHKKTSSKSRTLVIVLGLFLFLIVTTAVGVMIGWSVGLWDESSDSTRGSQASGPQSPTQTKQSSVLPSETNNAPTKVNFGVRTEPEGATVVLDGTLLGYTPYEGTVPHSEQDQQLIIHLTNFQVISRTIRFDRPQQLWITLQREGATQ